MKKAFFIAVAVAVCVYIGHYQAVKQLEWVQEYTQSTEYKSAVKAHLTKWEN